MEILVKNLQKKIRISQPRISKTVQAILLHERVKEATLSFVFVTHQKIRALNIKYLNRNYATDVLAFDALEQTRMSQSSVGRIRALCGDIIISTDAVLKNSRQFKAQPRRELTLYIIHGILHLLGYDDHGKSNTQSMREKESELLSFLEQKKLMA